MRKANRYAIDFGDPGRIILWLGISSALVLSALAVVPLASLERFPTFCPFKRFLGVECWGCGMTRALCAFLHGRVQLALTYNRGVLLTLPLLVSSTLGSILLRFRTRYE